MCTLESNIEFKLKLWNLHFSSHHVIQISFSELMIGSELGKVWWEFSQQYKWFGKPTAKIYETIRQKGVMVCNGGSR